MFLLPRLLNENKFFCQISRVRWRQGRSRIRREGRTNNEMMLFKGISPFRPWEEFVAGYGDGSRSKAHTGKLDAINAYGDYLHHQNEQVSILLRVKEDILAAHCRNAICMNSLIVFLASFFHTKHNWHATMSELIAEVNEQWRRDYFRILTYELSERMLKLTERLLRIESAPLLRAFDLRFWLRLAREFTTGSLEDSHRYSELVVSLLRTLFSAGKSQRNQFIRLLATIDVNDLVAEDVPLLCLLIMSANVSVHEDKIPPGQVTSILLALMCKEFADVELIVLSLQWLAHPPNWIDSDVMGLCQQILHYHIPAPKERLDCLQDYLMNTGVVKLVSLAKQLDAARRQQDSIDRLLEAFPKLGTEDARKLLDKNDGNLEWALAAGQTTKKWHGPADDEFSRLLDDKTEVKANMDAFIRAALAEEGEGEGNLYEDEYVDTFGDDVAASGKRRSEGPSHDIRSRKVR